jgi:hypothetical protein
LGRKATGSRQGAHVVLAVSLSFVLCLIVFGASASSAQAEEEHNFDALLSLIGGPGTSTADPIPDPGPNHPPAGTFSDPCGTAVDNAGNVYVAEFGAESDGSDGRIDIFDDHGVFITEIETGFGACDVAVDSEGALYVKKENPPQSIVRFTPDVFPPTPGTDYGAPVTVVPFDPGSLVLALAVNPADDHLFVTLRAGTSSRVAEYGPADAVAPGEPNELLDEFGEGFLQTPGFIAVNGSTGEVFVGSTVLGEPAFPTSSDPFPSVVYVYDSARVVTATIDGSDVPEGGFIANQGQLGLAVDEATGEVFVSDFTGARRLYRFVPTGTGDYEYLPDPELEDHSYGANAPGRVAVSNVPGANNERYVFVTSDSAGLSHLYAFAPEGVTGQPEISETAFEGVTETEAVVTAVVNPHGLPTVFHFEYVDDATFQERGFDNASRTPERAIGKGTENVLVTQALDGLVPDTTYHFRVVASNCGEAPPSSDCLAEGEESGEPGSEVPHVFATFSAPPLSGDCPNAALRVGPSALLPDCRAYELVSPFDTGGQSVNADTLGAIGPGFPTAMATSEGEAVAFEFFGTLPGFLGNGYTDRYVATRQAGGWETQFEGPTGAQMERPAPGGLSADLHFSFWRTSGGALAPDDGSLVLNNEPTEYVRKPDGTFQVLGEGALGIDPWASGRYISPGGDHVIVTSKVRIEEGAPPSGVEGIYDRTLDGTVHVVSLLPDNVPIGAGSEVDYLGVSADGSVVAFRVSGSGGSTVYLRRNNTETIPVTSGSATFAGLSQDGSLLTYVEGGNIFSFEVATGTATQVGTGGQSVVVNASADGSRIYFISMKKLVAFSGPAAGKPNFYFWNREDQTIGFIGVVAPSDVTGELVDGDAVHGLAHWTDALAAATVPDASHTTADGRFIVFESRANLTGQNSAQAREVYRYDSAVGTLLCLSCNPTLSESTAGAQLKSSGNASPINNHILIAHVVSNGQMVFFETSEALVARDSNGVQDVYEWEAAGVGGCMRPEGCLSLISLGRGSSPSYLYGTGADGRDVFFLTRDSLVPGAQSGALAVYTARINGGFPTMVQPSPCQLDACQQGPPPASVPGLPSSATVVGPGNVQPRKKCGKNRRKIKRQGVVRCVKKKQAQKAGSRRRAAR